MAPSVDDTCQHGFMDAGSRELEQPKTMASPHLCPSCLQPYGQECSTCGANTLDHPGTGGKRVCEKDHCGCSKELSISGAELTHPETVYPSQCIQCTDIQYSAKEDLLFEHHGRGYCRFHFSLLPGTQCAGCDQTIFTQFVEPHHLPDKKWHPECYMIYKFWHVRLSDAIPEDERNTDEKMLDQLVLWQSRMEERVNRVWNELSAFEESSATCISDMLLHVAAGARVESLLMAHQFVLHLEVLFTALDAVDAIFVKHDLETFQYHKASKDLCDQLNRFFDLLQQEERKESQDGSSISVTQALLPLVTDMAFNLKALVCVGLTGCMQLERTCHVRNATLDFLNTLLPLEKRRMWVDGRYWFNDRESLIDLTQSQTTLVSDCRQCNHPIQDACYQKRQLQWHIACFNCSQCQCKLVNEPHRVCIRKIDGALLCSRCCTDKTISTCDDDPFVHVTPLQQRLGLVKLKLAGLCDIVGRTLADDTCVPETGKNRPAKCPPSLFPMMDNNDQSITMADSLPMRHTKRSRQETSVLGYYMKSSHLSQQWLASVKRAKSALHGSSRAKQPWQQQKQQEQQSLRHMAVSTEQDGKGWLGLRRALTSNHHERSILCSILDRRRKNGLYQQTLQRASNCSVETSGDMTLNSPTLDLSNVSAQYLAELTPAQDTVIRYLAVLSMEPIVQHEFSREDLMSIVENKRVSLWHRFKAHLRPGVQCVPSLDSPPAHGTFRVPLAVLVVRDKQSNAVLPATVLHDSQMASFFSHQAMVPVFVQRCILTLLSMDITQEGIFRKNGNIRELKAMCESIDADGPTYPIFDGLQEEPIQLAALLKRYLRQLPEPLLTFRLHDVLVSAARMTSEYEAKTVLHLACCMLPKPNRDTMQIIFLFLKWVASFKDSNKMDIHNLACVFAPTVIASSPENNLKLPTEERQRIARDEIKVVEMLIQFQEEFCKVPSEFTVILQDPSLNGQQGSRSSRTLIHPSHSTSTDGYHALSVDIEKRRHVDFKHRRSWIPGRHSSIL